MCDASIVACVAEPALLALPGLDFRRDATVTLIDSSDDEYDAFDTVCRRLAGFDERVSPEWADGYLTALAAGPRAIGLAEVLPHLAGDAFERVFADPDDEAMARHALHARLRVLANHLDPEALLDAPEALRLQPLVLPWDDEARAELVREHGISEQDAAQLQTGALWAEGFVDALDDFAADLQPPADIDAEALMDYAALTGQVRLLMCADDDPVLRAHIEQDWKKMPPTREDLLDEACFAIQDLRVWWLDHAPRPTTRRVDARPGRNDACPCGSGLKYKKCHGKAG